jgi:hypothetical protein
MRTSFAEKHLPTRFGHTGQPPFECFFAEADAAELKAANIPARASAQLAAVAHPIGIFAMQLAVNHGFLCH